MGPGPDRALSFGRHQPGRCYGAGAGHLPLTISPGVAKVVTSFREDWLQPGDPAAPSHLTVRVVLSRQEAVALPSSTIGSSLSTARADVEQEPDVASAIALARPLLDQMSASRHGVSG